MYPNPDSLIEYLRNNTNRKSRSTSDDEVELAAYRGVGRRGLIVFLCRQFVDVGGSQSAHVLRRSSAAERTSQTVPTRSRHPEVK